MFQTTNQVYNTRFTHFFHGDSPVRLLYPDCLLRTAFAGMWLVVRDVQLLQEFEGVVALVSNRQVYSAPGHHSATWAWLWAKNGPWLAGNGDRSTVEKT